MKAISIRQPWAHAVVHLGKNIENRSWATSIRGQLAIQAAQNLHSAAVEDFLSFVRLQGLEVADLTSRDRMKGLPRGAVIGVVDLVDCVTASDSPWFEGPFGFVLANARPVIPFPCKGKLGFFDIDESKLTYV